MKKAYKIGGIFAALLFYIVLLCLQMHQMSPELENTIPSMDITGNGTFLAAENKTFYNVIYEVDADGEIVNQVCKVNHFWNRRERIVDISYSGYEDRVYMLCQRAKKNNKMEYKVYRINSHWNRAEKIGTVSKKNTFELKDFNVVDSSVYLTGVDTDKDKLLVYALDTEESEQAEMIMERGATEDGESTQNIKWADGAFSGKTLYGLSNRGQLFEYNQDNIEPFTLKDMGEVTWMSGNHNDVIYYDYMEDVFTSIEESPFLEILGGQQGVITVSYEKDTGNSVMLKRNEEGHKEVLIYIDDEEFYIDRITAGTFANLKRICFVATEQAVMFAVALALLVALWHLLRKVAKRPMLVAGIAFENMVLVAGVCVFAFYVSAERIQESYNVSALTYLTEEQAKCSEVLKEYTELIPEEFPVSQWFEPMKKLLSDWSVEEGNNGISYGIDLIEYREEESHILYSSENAYGRNIYGIYHKELLEKLGGMKNSEKKKTLLVKEEDGTYLYAIQFLEENDNNHLVWVAKMKIAR